MQANLVYRVCGPRSTVAPRQHIPHSASVLCYGQHIARLLKRRNVKSYSSPPSFTCFDSRVLSSRALAQPSSFSRYLIYCFDSLRNLIFVRATCLEVLALSHLLRHVVHARAVLLSLLYGATTEYHSSVLSDRLSAPSQASVPFRDGILTRARADSDGVQRLCRKDQGDERRTGRYLQRKAPRAEAWS